MAELEFLSGSTQQDYLGPMHRNGRPSTLRSLLISQAERHGDRIAFTFLNEDGGEQHLTYGELDRRARATAARLTGIVEPGERALMVYHPSLEFVCGFFGCLYAGVLAVPATYPKPRRPMPRLSAIARDCDAVVALTTQQTLQTLDFDRIQPDLSHLNWVATDDVEDAEAGQWRESHVESDDIAYLQYTSGSTSDPKGVMVSHSNLMHNLEMIREGFALHEGDGDEETAYTGVFWLPAYHDMGLIGGILEPIFVGGRGILMPPASFLKRPLRWLEAISKYRANISGAPNFAYELCAKKVTAEQRAELDLSCWRVAFCGAEPICADTLDRFADVFADSKFRSNAFYPCYGLAEATLIAAGNRGPAKPCIKRVMRSGLTEHRVVDANGHPAHQIQRLVSCGSALLDQELAIVDPESFERCAPDTVGEIWLRGRSVTQGYWNRQDETTHPFRARTSDQKGDYLRTGDLGFISDGHLYITGRVKDVIIIRGRNHYPQDIERTVERAHGALCPGAGTAFSVEIDDRERLVVIQEVDRSQRELDFEFVVNQIRRAVAVEHELEVYAVALIRQASLPMTTSGKAQRSLCRERFLTGQLKELVRWVDGKLTDRRNSKSRRTEADDNPPASDVPAAKASSTEHNERDGQTFHRSIKKSNQTKFVRPERPMSAGEVDRLAERIESWMIEWLVQKAGLPQDGIDRHRPFADLGLDSLTAVEMSQELEDWLDVKLTSVVAWNYPTPTALARFLAEQASGITESSSTGEAELPPADESEFEALLAEIEQLDDQDAESQLS